MNVIERRRKFHKIPELSFKEFETTREIAGELESLGIPFFIPDSEPNVGVVAWIDGADRGRTVALRADIDALPIIEDEGHNLRSNFPGRMHACGHDSHIAMLLTAAEELNKIKGSFKGRIYLIFEPAEEIGLGAKYMIKTGKWFEETDSIFGMHIWIPLKSGLVSVDEGERMAGSDRFKVKIIGKSGHAGEPDKTIDPILTASSAIMNLQSIVSRNNPPVNPLTISVCNINAGNVFNIIPDFAEFEGTVRYYARELKDVIEEKIRKVIKGTVEAFGAEYEMEYIHQIPPVINDKKASNIAKSAALKIFDAEDIVSFKKSALSDNFAFYAVEKPCCYAFLGAGSEVYNNPHHSSKFDIDESVLEKGAKLYFEYALEFLNKKEG